MPTNDIRGHVGSLILVNARYKNTTVFKVLNDARLNSTTVPKTVEDSVGVTGPDAITPRTTAREPETGLVRLVKVIKQLAGLISIPSPQLTNEVLKEAPERPSRVN